MNKRSSSQDRMLRFWNRIVYNALAPVYNAMDWLTFGAWWRLVRRALDAVTPGQRVLEVAFGPGKLHVELARRSELCVGIDLAEGMCRYTQRRLQKQGLPVWLARASVFEMPFADHFFDVVVSTFAFSGFPDGEQALCEMVRVLNVGGRVVFVDIGLPRDGNRTGVFWARLWARMGDYLYDLPAMMESAGLVVVQFEEFGPGRHIRLVVGEKQVESV